MKSVFDKSFQTNVICGFFVVLLSSMFDHLSDEPDFRFENWKNEASAEEIKNKKDENEN